MSPCSLAVIEVADIEIPIPFDGVVVAYVVNEQRDRRICGDHSDCNAAVLWLCLERQWPFVHISAVRVAGDERHIDVPGGAIRRYHRR